MSATTVGCRDRGGTTWPGAVKLAFWGVVVLVGGQLFGPLWIEAMRPGPGFVNDYFQDWGSARNYWVGLPVYAPHSTTVPLYLGLPSNPVADIEYNAHPPTSVLLALPLGGLDYPDAVLVWNVVSLAAFLGSLAIVAVVLPVPRPLLLPAFVLMMICHPVYGNVYLGQITLVLVLLVTSAWALDRSGRPGAAGLLVGLAAAIKLFPAYLLVYFAIQRRWRALVGASVSFAALSLAAVAVLGWDAHRDYLRVVLPRMETFRSYGYNAAIAGLWYKLFNPMADVGLVAPLWQSPTLARWGTLASNLAVTAIVAMAVWRARTLSRRNLAFGLTVSAMLLVSPVTWDFSMPLLLVPLAVIGRGAGRSSWMPAALMAVLAAIWIPQNSVVGIASMICTCHDTFSPAHMLGAPSVKFYALFATFVLGLAVFRAERGPDEGG